MARASPVRAHRSARGFGLRARVIFLNSAETSRCCSSRIWIASMIRSWARERGTLESVDPGLHGGRAGVVHDLAVDGGHGVAVAPLGHAEPDAGGRVITGDQAV